MNGILEEFAVPIHEWARRKLGSDGDDLAQEVLLQVCVALSDGREIDDIERYVWKIARYTWCNWLRRRKKDRMNCSINDIVLPEADFADAHAEDEAELQLKVRLRREMGELMRQERELMIAHYIDGLPVAEAARRAGVTESTAAWKLHEARRKVREKLMKNIESYSYQPGRLSIGVCGDPGPGVCDVFQINGNLIQENILLICYGTPRSAEEIAAITGVPMCYIERDIEWLYEREFLNRTGRKYQTAFAINDKAHTQFLDGVYDGMRGAYAKALERVNAAEADIRALGFYGDDFEWKRLMWSMLMIFASTAIRTSECISDLREGITVPKRPDGGTYRPTGSEMYEDNDIWHGYNGLVSLYSGYGDGPVNVLWLGAYNFADEFSRIAKNLGAAKGSELFDMYVSLADGTFKRDSVSDYHMDILARDIADGAVTSDLRPDFVVMESAKLERLRSEIFEPIARDIMSPALSAVSGDILKYVRSKLPAGMKDIAEFETWQDLSHMCYRIIEFAGRNGMLYLPKDAVEGGKLTLMLVK